MQIGTMFFRRTAGISVPGIVFTLMLLFSFSVFSSEDVETEGGIQAIGADSLVVNGITFRVDSSTEVVGPTGDINFSDLQVGFFVEVEANIQPDSSLLATRIEMDAIVDVEGAIEALGSDSLVVRSTVFQVDSSTEILGEDGTDSLSFSDLMEGDFVEVHANFQADSTYLAFRIELEDTNDNIRLRGRVQAVDSTSLMVNNLIFQVDSTTRIEGPHDTTLSLADLLPGDSVKVRARLLVDSSRLATRIELEEEHPDFIVESRISALEAHSITVDSLSAIVNAATRIKNMNDEDIPFSSLSVGDSVQIRIAIRPDSSFLATRITVREFLTGLPGNELTRERIAKQFRLGQNFPNPFNPSTSIPVTVRTTRWMKVTITIYNLLGQQIRTLFNGLLNQGAYTFQWNGRNDRGALVPSGVYFYQLKVDRQVVDTKRMLMVK